ncbi:MAG: O-antigen ligase family protein [Patescibacteria group bacterium]
MFYKIFSKRSIIHWSLLILAVAIVGDRLLVINLPAVGRVPLLDVVVVGLAIWGGLSYVRKIKSSVTPLFVWFGGLFIILAGIALAGSGRWLTLSEIFQSSLFWWRWIFYFGLIFWVAELPVKIKQWLAQLLGIMWGTVALLGWIQLIFVPDLGFWERLGWDPHQHRLVSTFLDPNLLGGFLVLGLAFCLAQLTSTHLPKSKRWWWGGLAALLLISIIFTYSRSALLALLVLGLFWGWRYWKIALIGLAVMGLIYGLSPRWQERISGAMNLDETVRYRLESWDQAVDIMRQQPWLGVGYNTLRFTREDYGYQPVSHATTGFDSSLLTIGVTAGSLGLAAYLGLLVSALAWAKQQITNTNRVVARVAQAFLAGMSALLVHSLFVNSLLYAPIMVVGWIILGLIWNNRTDDV